MMLNVVKLDYQTPPVRIRSAFELACYAVAAAMGAGLVVVAISEGHAVIAIPGAILLAAALFQILRWLL